MSAASVRRARTVGVALALLAVGTTGVRGVAADAALADLRLFVTPERRAALDGAPDGEGGPSPSDPAPRQRVPTAPTPAPGPRVVESAGSERVRAERRGSPPSGSATLRSSRGTSRIVDGVPERTGPS